MAFPRAVSTVALLLLLLGVMADAALIETFNNRNCAGPSVNEFYVGRNTCKTLNYKAGSVRVSQIDSGVRVSFHNQKNCKTATSMAQGHGPHCRDGGASQIQGVYIA